MRPVPPRLPLLLLCCAAALPARAVTVTRVDVDGLPDPAMVENVRLSLSSAGKQYVRGKKRISVVLDVKPASGKTVSKKLKLTR